MVSGSDIKHFFNCPMERSLMQNPSEFKGARWGIVCEKLYKNILDDPAEKIYPLVQATINQHFPDVSLSSSSIIIDGLSKVLEEFARRKHETLYDANLTLEWEDTIAQIDFIIKGENNAGFIREFKSYASPGYYAWNSDIMQLTVENFVFSKIFKIDSYYGEIAYLGDGKIVGINVQPYFIAFNFAKARLQQKERSIKCTNCKAFHIPCYNHVRQKYRPDL